MGSISTAHVKIFRFIFPVSWHSKLGVQRQASVRSSHSSASVFEWFSNTMCIWNCWNQLTRDRSCIVEAKIVLDWSGNQSGFRVNSWLPSVLQLICIGLLFKKIFKAYNLNTPVHHLGDIARLFLAWRISATTDIHNLTRNSLMILRWPLLQLGYFNRYTVPRILIDKHT
jgi:hypothetical protein